MYILFCCLDESITILSILKSMLIYNELFKITECIDCVREYRTLSSDIQI